MEQASGVMHIWGSDLNYRWDNQTTIASTYRSRDSSSIATITSSAHSLAVGDVVTLTSFGGTGYNKSQCIVVSVPSTTTFTYNCVGSGEPLTADTAGIIGIGEPTFNDLNVVGGRGQITIQGPYELVAGVYGGNWANGTNAGSRSSSWYNCVWYHINTIGLRGRCDHLVVP
jgi:hypothetical protein